MLPVDELLFPDLVMEEWPTVRTLSNTSTFIAGNSSRTRSSSAIWCGPPERLFDALRSPKLTTTGG